MVAKATTTGRFLLHNFAEADDLSSQRHAAPLAVARPSTATPETICNITQWLDDWSIDSSMHRFAIAIVAIGTAAVPPVRPSVATRCDVRRDRTTNLMTTRGYVRTYVRTQPAELPARFPSIHPVRSWTGTFADGSHLQRCWSVARWVVAARSSGGSLRLDDCRSGDVSCCSR